MARAKQDDDDLFLDDLGDNFLDDDSGDSGQGQGQSQGQSAGQAPAQTDDFFEETDVPGQLAVDVYQTKEDVVVVAPVPGVSKNDIDISLVENTLTLRGSRQPGANVPDGDYFAQELHWGEFSRSIILPAQVKE
ncbi:MAG: Hsp20/alpha crystallin family protein, partial [Acidobacteriota bacterium]